MKETLQVLDANINRVCEGLRVVEDITRFILKDRELQKRIKWVRHVFVKICESEGLTLERRIEGRDTESDIGKSFNFKVKGDYREVLKLNLGRIKEGLRVIEEFSRLESRAVNFRKLRFIIYDLEQRIISRVSRRYQRLRKASLYFITHIFNGVEELVRKVLDGGCDIIQLREKELSDYEIYRYGEKLKDIIERYDALFIVNDRVDIACALESDGVHIGKEDLPWDKVRKIGGSNIIIGVTTRSFSEAKEYESRDIDYISIGPVFKSPTKPNLENFVKKEDLLKVSGEIDKVIFAIGGINLDNIDYLIECGIRRVCLSSAILSSTNPEEYCNKLKRKLEGGIL